MIEYLEKLVEDKEYQKALDYAEQLLLSTENTSWDLMVIYSLLCESRFAVDEFYGAQVAGQLAVNMAKELEAWDYYGYSAHWLGVCYDRLRQPEKALIAWYDYLTYVTHYTKSLMHHATVLYNIGLVSAQAGQIQEGLRMLQRAAEVAGAHHDERKVHGIRHALIDSHLRYNQLEQIPPLLAKCGLYLRRNPTHPTHNKSFLWHLVLRVRFALATNRPQRAVRVAQRGLALSDSLALLEHSYHFRLLLAQVYERLGMLSSAMNEAVTARGLVIEARRYDLEYEAANYMYDLLHTHPELVDSFGEMRVEDRDS